MNSELYTLAKKLAKRALAETKAPLDKSKALQLADDILKELQESINDKSAFNFGTLKKFLVGALIAVSFFNARSANASSYELYSQLGRMQGGGDFFVSENSYSGNKKTGEGSGEYIIKAGPYNIKGKYKSDSSSSSHDVTTSVDSNASKEDKEKFKDIANKLYKTMNTVGTEVVQR